MAKLIAILNVVAWAGFWAFGYLALAGDGKTTLAMLLAAAGGGIGLWAWLWLAWHAEEIGYARRANRARQTDGGEPV